MKDTIRRIILWGMTAAIVTGMQAIALAAEDDVVDEAEIYMQESVLAPLQSSTPVASSPEGTQNPIDLSKSPAVAGDGRIYLEGGQEPEEVGDTGAVTLISPATGMPSMMLPIGIGLLALGCLPMLLRKRNK